MESSKDIIIILLYSKTVAESRTFFIYFTREVHLNCSQF